VTRTGRLPLLFGIVAICFLLDQGSKGLAAAYLRDAPPRIYLGDLFRLQFALNQGSFLGLGGSLGEEVRFGVFVVGVGALLSWLTVYILRAEGPRLSSVVGIALILGGGFSNWADRVMYGNVVIDFMNVGIGWLRSGIFNVADLQIEAGVILLLVANWRASRAPQPAEESAAAG